MAELLLRALQKAGRSINNPFAMGGSYVLPKRGDTQRDFVKIVGDMRTVGKTLNSVSKRELAKNGK